MENKIMMPASYNVLSCEEMTYTEGGATVGQAVAAWLWPGYATVIGINTCREARKKDHDNWVSNVWSDIKADCKGNVTNTFCHAGMIFWNAASTIRLFCCYVSGHHLLLTFRSTPKGFLRRLFMRRAAVFISIQKQRSLLYDEHHYVSRCIPCFIL